MSVNQGIKDDCFLGKYKVKKMIDFLEKNVKFYLLIKKELFEKISFFDESFHS